MHHKIINKKIPYFAFRLIFYYKLGSHPKKKDIHVIKLK
jgi:hypothetical protein